MQRMKLRDDWGYIINVCAIDEQQASEQIAGGGKFFDATTRTVEALTEGLRSEVCVCPFVYTVLGHIREIIEETC